MIFKKSFYETNYLHVYVQRLYSEYRRAQITNYRLSRVQGISFLNSTYTCWDSA